MKKILIIDDQFLFRLSLKVIFQEVIPNCEIVEAETIATSLPMLNNEHFDLVILDIQATRLTELKVIEILPHITAVANTVIITAADEELYVKQCLRAGVKGFVHKSVTHHDFITAISTVLSGRHHVSSDVHDLLLHNTKIPASDIPVLSPRENQVMKLVAQGKMTKDIAKMLQLSSNTISTYKTNVLRKMNVSNVFDLQQKIHAF